MRALGKSAAFDGPVGQPGGALDGRVEAQHLVHCAPASERVEAAPARARSSVSRDPAFAEKVADVVGLYLDPPGGAVVLSIDEKTQIQALDRTQPLLPIDVRRRPRNAPTTTSGTAPRTCSPH